MVESGAEVRLRGPVPEAEDPQLSMRASRCAEAYSFSLVCSLDDTSKCSIVVNLRNS